MNSIRTIFAFVAPLVLASPFGLLSLSSTPVHAAAAGLPGAIVGRGSRWYEKWCNKTAGPGNTALCEYLTDLWDPEGYISEFGGTITYDTSLFTFDPLLSGPLCAFATPGGYCPSPSATYGTVEVPENDLLDLILTDPVNGGSWSYDDDPANGILSFSINFPQAIHIPEETNLFMLAFKTKAGLNLANDANPGDEYRFATYTAPLAGDFNTDAACGSTTPIGGVEYGGTESDTIDFHCVPEPGSLVLAVSGLLGMSALRKRRSRT
ncbi:MAG: PEP-CTERM sorting domain-containing protein [Candidatus Promineifilaceae bacterium]